MFPNSRRTKWWRWCKDHRSRRASWECCRVFEHDSLARLKRRRTFHTRLGSFPPCERSFLDHKRHFGPRRDFFLSIFRLRCSLNTGAKCPSSRLRISMPIEKQISIWRSCCCRCSFRCWVGIALQTNSEWHELASYWRLCRRRLFFWVRIDQNKNSSKHNQCYHHFNTYCWDVQIPCI